MGWFLGKGVGWKMSVLSGVAGFTLNEGFWVEDECSKLRVRLESNDECAELGDGLGCWVDRQWVELRGGLGLEVGCWLGD